MTNQERKWREPVRIGEIIPDILREIEEQAAFSECDRIRDGEETKKNEDEDGPQVCPSCNYVEPPRDEPATTCPNCGTPYEF